MVEVDSQDAAGHTGIFTSLNGSKATAFHSCVSVLLEIAMWSADPGDLGLPQLLHGPLA